MLTPSRFHELVAALPYKKELPEAVYLHRETLQHTCPTLSQFVCAVAKALKLADEEWHLVKLAKRDFRLSLLCYPTFFEEPYPSLNQSVTVDLTKLKHTVTRYEEHDNPPILHRKEVMLAPHHPMAEQCRQITEEGELAGLYEQPRMIGFKQSWLRLIARHGYALVDGRLFRQSALPDLEHSPQIDRHKTALTRYQLSAPMKMLARHGYLNGDYSLFDYGCGRGDDLRELEAHGIAALGWDPNFRPDAEKVSSHLVNLGYVINVIEDRDERTDALLGAWELTQTLLVVSAMLAGDNFIAQFTPYRDGVITSRNTFQKYYNQSELRGFIARTLDEQPLAMGPGLFYVFKDKEEEQRFLSERQRRHHGWRQLSRPPFERVSKAQHLLQTHQALFDDFWQMTLSLGRLPTDDEFEQMASLRELIGSPSRALRLIETQEEIAMLEQARQERIEDLSVYL
ncbi:DNA phosphorothioation-associated putative methyltransferase [Aeromonas veronii]|uniref:DNA phosphorothioation-associated putative methyltransferase n=1 Tax=Aeromonas veronii TaxID=654 RepID=UPI0009E640B1|nr:DNA phosphorothioation-associated putative methyltransferase [Aeromonas veronii]